MLKETQVYFTIGNSNGTTVNGGIIPMNYFCSWDLPLDPTKTYMITIDRTAAVLEDINLVVEGKIT
jgi:hypothetical protein